MKIELSRKEIEKILDGLIYSLNGYQDKHCTALKEDWELIDKLKELVK